MTINLLTVSFDENGNQNQGEFINSGNVRLFDIQKELISGFLTNGNLVRFGENNELIVYPKAKSKQTQTGYFEDFEIANCKQVLLTK